MFNFFGFSSSFFETVIEILIRVAVTVMAISVHECAHGYVSYKLGDPTAKYSGRLTLNPLKHMDPIGTICMILFRFGWAKPVPINTSYYKNKKQGTVLVSLAGPVSNLLLALLGALIYALIGRYFGSKLYLSGAFGYFQMFFSTLILMNVYFAAFNLIPIPPLDGSKILGAVLPLRMYYQMMQYERYMFPVLILLSFTGIFGRVISFIADPLINLLQSLISLIVYL